MVGFKHSQIVPCIYPVIFILLLVQPYSHGHSSGAPVHSCSTMSPGHGASAQTTPAPYKITVNALNGGLYRIKLEALKDYFEGYLLRPKVSPKLAGASDDFSGTFIDVPPEAKILNCGTEKASAVTHTNNSKKKSVEFDWQSPANYNGTIAFVATVVHDYSTFWTNVQSFPVPIQKSGTSPRSSSLNSNGDQLNAALLSVYEGCGSTKNCVASPENCLKNKNCDGAASVLFDSGVYQVEMFAKASKYVALGLSDDASMGGDMVSECTDENGKVVPHRSWNEPNRKRNKRLDDLTGVTLVNGLVVDGNIYCKLTLQPVLYNDGEKVDLNTERLFLLLAAGKKLAEGRPGVGFHDLYAVSSKTSYLLSEVGSESSSDSFYNGCGSTKTCFGMPEGCVDKQNCLTVTAVTVQGNRFLISMQAKNVKYVATGLSDDRHMGDDTVVECVDNGTVQAFQSWNVPNRYDNKRLDPNELEKLSGSVTDNILRCTVIFDPKNTKSFQYDREYYLLLAAGPNLRPNGVGRHTQQLVSDKQVSIPSEQKTSSFYSGCDRTKACFGNTPNCVQTESCNFAVAVSSDYNNKFTFQLVGDRSPAYVAVGLSADNLMGDDLVFECVQDPQTNQVRSHMSWNMGPATKYNERLRENYSQLMNGSIVDGKLQCVITIDNPTFNVRGKTFNLVRDKYFLMVASGSELNAPSAENPLGSVSYHDKGRAVGGEARALADSSPVKAASRLLVVLHGSFMVAAWIGLASLGIALARYYKQTWITGTCFGKDIWFFWHRLFMFTAVILTLAGSTLIYIHSGGFIFNSPGETHMLFGFATVILAVLQPIGAFFRPHPGTSRRPIFNWLHWLAGNSAHILSIVTIFLSVNLTKAELPQWTDYVIASFVAYYVIYHLLLSFLGWRSESSGRGSINEIQLKNINPPRNMPPAYEREKDSPYSGARKFLFTLHLLIIAGFCVLLILLISRGSAVY